MFFIIQKKKNKYGFTLIELMASISIIGLMSAIFIVNYASTNDKARLNDAVQRVVTNIKLTQSYALGLNEFNNTMSEGGWGIHFDINFSDNYIIFADVDADGVYNSGEEFRVIELAGGVNIDSMDIGGTKVDIVFLPPDPTTYINGLENESVQIVFIGAKGSKKTIEINFLGLTDIID